MEQEIKLVIAKAKDIVRISKLRNIPKFTGFLTPSEQSAISSAVFEEGTLFFGGYDNAERRMFGSLPEYLKNNNFNFPISAVKFSYRSVDKLSHRDVLGALMSTGITRDSIGDICFNEGYAIAFVTEEIAPYIIGQVEKIGQVGVKAEILSVMSAADSFLSPKTESISFTVSSPRLDAILNGLLGCGRNKAEEYINLGKVFVNSLEVLKVTRTIKVGDKITVRGVGKFCVTGSGNFSKKGREIFTAEKYI